MTSETDNRTTELREKLNKLVIELDRLDIALDSPASDMTLGEYEQKREKLLDGFIQAIAATLGGEREKALEELVRNAYWLIVRAAWTHVSQDEFAADWTERVSVLGIEVD